MKKLSVNSQEFRGARRMIIALRSCFGRSRHPAWMCFCHLFKCLKTLSKPVITVRSLGEELSLEHERKLTGFGFPLIGTHPIHSRTVYIQMIPHIKISTLTYSFWCMVLPPPFFVFIYLSPSLSIPTLTKQIKRSYSL